MIDLLITFVAVLIVLGLIWAIIRYLPLEPWIKNVVGLVLLLILVLWMFDRIGIHLR